MNWSRKVKGQPPEGSEIEWQWVEHLHYLQAKRKLGAMAEEQKHHVRQLYYHEFEGRRVLTVVRSPKTKPKDVHKAIEGYSSEDMLQLQRESKEG